MTATDTLYPTHLAMRDEHALGIPISMVVCRECTNVFACVTLDPQNAPSQCCYCGEPMRFNDGTDGGFVKLGQPAGGTLP